MNVSKISAIVSGYTKTKTGIAAEIIVVSPKFATPVEKSVKPIAYALKEIFGNIFAKSAAIDAISPILVVRHAKSTKIPSNKEPMLPK